MSDPLTPFYVSLIDHSLYSFGHISQHFMNYDFSKKFFRFELNKWFKNPNFYFVIFFPYNIFTKTVEMTRAERRARGRADSTCRCCGRYSSRIRTLWWWMHASTEWTLGGQLWANAIVCTLLWWVLLLQIFLKKYFWLKKQPLQFRNPFYHDF